MSDAAHWDTRYREGNSPWDTGRPSSELQRVLAETKVQPCRAVELGCGTGSNCVWLAQQGFEVTGVDLSSLAIDRARRCAEAAGVAVHFVVGDALNLPDLGAPFDFFFDRGCYHVVRRISADVFVQTLNRITTAAATGLVLAGNAREPHDPGPPVVSEDDIRRELGRVFDVVQLREFRFDPSPGLNENFLGWSCLLRKRARAVR